MGETGALVFFLKEGEERKHCGFLRRYGKGERGNEGRREREKKNKRKERWRERE